MVQGAARSPSWVLRMGFKKNPHYISKKGYIIVLNPSFSRFLFRLRLIRWIIICLASSME